MTNRLKLLTILFGALSFSNFISGRELPKSYATCIACHGQNAEGNGALSAPALAGLDARYLERQLKYFKKGLRGQSPKDQYGQQMTAFAKSLDDAQIKDLSLAISKIPGSKSPSTKGDPEQGKKYFTSNCSSCHGVQGQGNPAFKAPALIYQDEDYLIRQLMNFRNGVRGTERADVLGRQMAMMAKILPSDQAAEDVIAYIKSL